MNLWLTPRPMKRHALRLLIAVGVVIAVPGSLWLTVLDHGPFAFAILVPGVVIGTGGGLISTPLAALVTTGVQPERRTIRRTAPAPSSFSGSAAGSG